MLISIGILAWNEEDVIATTLSSLFRQSAFQAEKNDLPDTEWEIIVVPNGCSDNTSAIARRVLTDLVAQQRHQKITFSIYELQEAGKSNAWNYYIHEFSNKHADLIMMIDADIEFGETETILNTVKALCQNPRATVAVDQPLNPMLVHQVLQVRFSAHELRRFGKSGCLKDWLSKTGFYAP
jgi:glycosyltransferase involved in cell wall biosynthesis